MSNRLPSIAFALLAASPLGAQSAAPAAQPLARANFITTMDGEFRKVDTDKNGMLTRVEVDRFQKVAALAQAQERSRLLFAQLDGDRNGQISPVEFSRLPLNPRAANPSILLKFDSSRDGQVSLIEHRAGTLANFDRLDSDKDGLVSPAEMRAGGIE